MAGHEIYSEFFISSRAITSGKKMEVVEFTFSHILRNELKILKYYDNLCNFIHYVRSAGDFFDDMAKFTTFHLDLCIAALHFIWTAHFFRQKKSSISLNESI